VHDWKSCGRVNCLVGSNPTLSVYQPRCARHGTLSDRHARTQFAGPCVVGTARHACAGTFAAPQPSAPHSCHRGGRCGATRRSESRRCRARPGPEGKRWEVFLGSLPASAEPTCPRCDCRDSRAAAAGKPPSGEAVDLRLGTSGCQSCFKAKAGDSSAAPPACANRPFRASDARLAGRSRPGDSSSASDDGRARQASAELHG
jgi:hypothetical protein